MTPGPSTDSQKAASGRPPVVTKNLRRRPAGMTASIQKSRLAAAPRRSATGTCEKPVTDAATIARDPPRCHPRPINRLTLALIPHNHEQSRASGVA